MKFIAGGLNKEYLLNLANNSVNHTEMVVVAAAYASSDPVLFQLCRDKNIRLKFYGRYDRSVPIATVILKKFLDMKTTHYKCRLIPDIFHPKVVWWKDYGVYVGSANLTERGWFGNIEAGIFLESYEIIENDLEEELNNFFSELEERSFPLTEEVYNELCELEKEQNRINALQKNLANRFKQKRKIPPMSPLTRIIKKSSIARRKRDFVIEWNETLQLLRNISDRVSADEYRPKWVKRNVPRGVQVDQFLHAFYYAIVKEGRNALHHEFYERNKLNSEQALLNAMVWWKSLEKPPHSEDQTIYKWAPFLKAKLHMDNILELTKPEFTKVCSNIHAMRDHSLRVKYSEFGLSQQLPRMKQDQRIEYLSEWLYEQRSKGGKSAIETINYVLYGGDSDSLSDRLWESITNPDWFISHLGVSSLGEIAGWAMPDKFPPRNGRTSKSLYALGNKVRIHSE